MSNRLRFKIVKKIFSSTFFVVKVFGLWPYKTNGTKSAINRSFYSVAYSVVVPILMLFGYVKVGSDAYSGATTSNATLASWTLQLVVILYSYLVILSILSLYIGQHLQCQRIKLTYVKFKRVAHYCMQEFDTKFVKIKLSTTVALLFKTIIYDILHFSMFIYNLSTVTDESHLRLYWGIFIYLPIIAIRLYTVVFYESILIANVLFEQLNNTLENTISSLNIAIRTKHRNGGKKQILYVEELHQLNYELEKTSMIFFELVDAMKSLNSFFGFHNILWITRQLVILIIQYFYQFVAIEQLLVNKENDFTQQNVAIACAIILSSYEIYTTAHACNSLLTEVCIHRTLILMMIFTVCSIIWLKLSRLANNFVNSLNGKFAYYKDETLSLFTLSLQGNQTVIIIHSAKLDLNTDIGLERTVSLIVTLFVKEQKECRIDSIFVFSSIHFLRKFYSINWK